MPITSAAPIQLAGNAYKLPSFDKTALPGRADKKRLLAHFKAIGNHYRHYHTALIRAERLAATNAKKGNKKVEAMHRKSAKAAKAKMTEAIGEMNATNKILRDRPNWQLLDGFSAGVGIDQIWKSGSGKINVVEAKGPGAKLGVSDAKGGQMSKSWVEKTAKGMSNDHGITAALAPGAVGGVGGVPKVRGYVITSTPTGKSAMKNWDKLTYN